MDDRRERKWFSMFDMSQGELLNGFRQRHLVPGRLPPLEKVPHDDDSGKKREPAHGASSQIVSLIKV